MKISNKLLSGFLTIACLLGINFILTESIILNSQKKINSVVKNQVKETQADIELNNDLQKLRWQLTQILILKQQKSSIENQKEKINNILLKSIKDLDDDLEIHENILEELTINRNKIERDKIKNITKDIEELVELKGLLNHTFSKVEYYFELLDNDRIVEAHQFLKNDLKIFFEDDLAEKFHKESRIVLEELETQIIVIFQKLKTNNYWLAVFNLLILIIIYILGKFLYKSLMKPLSQLRAAALEVTEGNLNYQLNIETKDELKDVAVSFQEMTESLKNSTVSTFYLNQIISSIIDSLIIIDLNGNIQQVNQATCNILGYSEKELIGLKFKNIVEESAFSLKDIKKLGYLENKQTEYITKKGEKIPIILSSSFIANKLNMPCGILCIAKDITNSYAAQEELKISRERYALAASNQGLWDWDVVTNTIYYSSGWKELLGYQDNEIKPIIKEWFDRVHPEYRSFLNRAIQDKRTSFKISYPILHKDGQYRWMLSQGIKLSDRTGNLYRVVGSQIDINTNQIVEEKLYYTSRHDFLTGLANRTVFEEQLKKSIKINQKNGNFSFSVIFINIDRFKLINSELGYQIGDKLLIYIAQKIQDCLKNNELLARLEADEFAILLPKINEISQTINIAELLQKKLSLPINLSGKKLTVNASMGIVSSSENYTSIQDILRDGKRAISQAKANENKRYIMFEPNIHAEKILRSWDLERDLRTAIAKEELEIFYQPIIDLESIKIVGFETLLRWNHPQKGLILPSEFIPIAEKTGLITAIGNWLIEKVVAQIRIWLEQDEIFDNMFLSMNVSIFQLKNSEGKDLVYKLKQLIVNERIKPKFLKIEITESAIIEDVEKVGNILHEIKDLGFKIAIDDFGTGYSSLASLHLLPIDSLKIHNSFLSDLQAQPYKLELIKIIINLAKNLGISLIVEGVETNNQLAILKEFNCKYAQGYLFSEPVNADEAKQKIISSLSCSLNQ